MDTKRFQALVYAHYKKEGRDLPWRHTRNPYCILVSEIMLQQTQALRVIPFYQSFLKRFPTIRSLAEAPLKDVLTLWQGLGYNRRAKMLHMCAKEVVGKHNARMPATYETLVSLPGIGPYTAGAVLAFAHNIPHPVIETNIRTVYLHHFFPREKTVSDSDILMVIERTLDTASPREWYAALMDYGAHLKKTIGNQNTRSRHYVRQKAYRGSDRHIRGLIIRTLTKSTLSNVEAFAKEHAFEETRVKSQCMALKGEGLITRRGRAWVLR